MKWYEIPVDATSLGIFTVCITIAFLFIVYVIEPEQFQVCTVSIQGATEGNFDLNTEKFKDFIDFSVNSAEINITVTAPCNWISKQGYLT